MCDDRYMCDKTYAVAAAPAPETIILAPIKQQKTN